MKFRNITRFRKQIATKEFNFSKSAFQLGESELNANLRKNR